ncbi:MAG: M42 family metallopeptidase [Anaerolineales bacterium]|nr:M42 family metallopeptidase [Anaerolineales bacterium]
MTNLPKVDQEFMLEFLIELLNTPSPTGYTHHAITLVSKTLKQFDQLELSATRKGALIARWPGEASYTPRGLTAHIDTLGAMVKEIKSNGRLKLTNIGGFAWNTVEGEGLTVFTGDEKEIRGSLLLTKSSSHVHGVEVHKTERNADALEVRLDARTSSQKETRALGIEVGDFVAFDPRVEINNGFIRSRHLDDKACVANIVAAVKALHDAGLKPAQDVTLHFSNYEEVGHGASAGFPEDMAELVTVDMAALGEGQNSDEFHATLCVKDSGGPYHYSLNKRLRQLAEAHHIPHKVDIYPYYGSDGEAYWRAGGDVAVSLIGPGVDASHSYERTHMDALKATTDWIIAYLLS